MWILIIQQPPRLSSMNIDNIAFPEVNTDNSARSHWGLSLSSVSGGTRVVPLSLTGDARKSCDKLARPLFLPSSLYQADTAVFSFLTSWVFGQVGAFRETHYFHLKIDVSFLGNKLWDWPVVLYLFMFPWVWKALKLWPWILLSSWIVIPGV